MADMKEEFKVNGEMLLKKVKELIQEGNIRRITIKDKDGKELVTFPLTIGVVGAVLAPVLAAVGAIAALVFWSHHSTFGSQTGAFLHRVAGHREFVGYQVLCQPILHPSFDVTH